MMKARPGALLLPLLLATLAAAVPLADETPGAPTDTPRQGVVYRIRLNGKTACPAHAFLTAPACPSTAAVPFALRVDEISLTRWTLQTATPSPGASVVGSGITFSMQRAAQLPCNAFLAASSTCATTGLAMAASAADSQFGLERVAGAPTQFLLVARNRGTCPGPQPPKYVGALNVCNQQPVTQPPKPMSASMYGKRAGAVTPLLKWEFESMCLAEGTACDPNLPAGKLGCCPVRGVPMACLPREQGFPPPGFVCAGKPAPPSSAPTATAEGMTKVSVSVAPPGSTGGSTAAAKFVVELVEEVAQGTPRGPYRVAGTGFAPSTKVFEEGVAGVPAEGLCGGTWRARVRYGSVAGWGAWTLLTASNAATTDPCPLCKAPGEACESDQDGEQGNCCDTTVCKSSFCVGPPSGATLVSYVLSQDDTEVTGKVTVANNGVGATSQVLPHYPTLTYSISIKDQNDAEVYSGQIVSSGTSTSEEFIASQPEGYCVNSGTRNFLYLTISVSNGVGTPAVASGDPLLCPCLPSGTACDGGLLCTDEGPNSWCCENYVPAYLGPRRLVTPPGGSDYCNCLPADQVNPASPTQNCCGIDEDQGGICTCRAEGEEMTVWGPESCCAGLSVVPDGDGTPYCGCLPLSAPTTDAASCCTGTLNDNEDACGCLPIYAPATDPQKCCTGAINQAPGYSACACLPTGDPATDAQLCCTGTLNQAGDTCACVPIGDPASTPTECCSNALNDNADACGCLLPGAATTDAQLCCTGALNQAANACACLPTGDPATDPRLCCTGVLNQNLDACACLPDGALAGNAGAVSCCAGYVQTEAYNPPRAYCKCIGTAGYCMLLNYDTTCCTKNFYFADQCRCT